MAKISTKELMAARNPLARPKVAPVDIYAVTPPVAEPEVKSVSAKPAKEVVKPAAKSKARTASSASSRASKAIKSGFTDDDPVSPYSTYLRKSQVKAIKFRAIERDLKDQNIVQEAIDEYFVRHP
jgi:hypothetical protein